MAQLRFFRDDDGSPRAQAADTEQLAAFLQSDIQDSIEIADALLDLLQLPQESEFNGNAHSVSIGAEAVSLCSQFDDELDPEALSREAFSDALRAWRTFILTR